MFPLQVEQLTKDWSDSWHDKRALLERYSVDINQDRAGVLIRSLLPHLIALEPDVLSTGVTIYHLRVELSIAFSCHIHTAFSLSFLYKILCSFGSLTNDSFSFPSNRISLQLNFSSVFSTLVLCAKLLRFFSQEGKTAVVMWSRYSPPPFHFPSFVLLCDCAGTF